MIARMCCSNWEVAAPSIVQWPELWTRGASSLTTSEPSRSRNSSAVSVPHRSIAAASVAPIAVARSATSRRDGCRRHGFGQDPGVVAVPGDREGRARPVERAGDDDRQLDLEIELALREERRAGRATQRLPGAVEVGGVQRSASGRARRSRRSAA